MIDMQFYGGLALISCILLYLAYKEDERVLVLFVGIIFVLMGAFALSQDIGTNISTTTNSTSYNASGNLTETVNVTETQKYSIPFTFMEPLGVILILLGLYILLNEMFVIFKHKGI